MPQIIEVSLEPVHAVNHHRVAGSHKTQQRIELWPSRVLARRLVGKDATQFDAVKLTLGALLERTDPHIADSLTALHDGTIQ